MMMVCWPKSNKGEVMIKDDLVCDDPLEDRCEECPLPDGCVWECAMKKYIEEDVAKIRNEEIQ